VLAALADSDIRFLIGGAFAFCRHAGIDLPTKDLDLMIEQHTWPALARALRDRGIYATLKFPHWLGKALSPAGQVDIIFNSGAGVSPVNATWFAHSVRATVLGHRVRLCGVEELIWSKGFVMERERFDGSDVLHLLRETGPSLDWPRLLMRFGDYWRVLFSHIILFGFVYPDKRQNVPTWVMEELTRRLSVSRPNLQSDVCYGTLLSREQYLDDVERQGWRDSRLEPPGRMTEDDVTVWTQAIPEERRSPGSG